MNRNSESMREITIATKTQQELIAAMLSKSQKDSHTVKILTAIALLYLPASLVAVSLLPPSHLLSIISFWRMNLTDDSVGDIQLESSPNVKRWGGTQRSSSDPVPFFLDLFGHNFLPHVTHVPPDIMATIPTQKSGVDSWSCRWVAIFLRLVESSSPFWLCVHFRDGFIRREEGPSEDARSYRRASEVDQMME